MSSTQFFRNTPKGIIFADPAKSDYRVRFDHSELPKKVGTSNTLTHITEIRINDANDIIVDGVAGTDNIAISLRVSAAPESKARVKSILTQLGLQAPVWSDENVLVGFQPTTLPVNPTA